jgi:3-dehydroquinate dehydratase-2
MKLLILNGPNLNLLGIREPEVYGTKTYLDLCKLIEAYAAEVGAEVEIRQTNHEGVLVDWIQEARDRFDGIVLNPAAYTHTSVALLDAVKAVGVPAVEVHITDPDTREPFRAISYVRAACKACVKGKGLRGYLTAMDILLGLCPEEGSEKA